MERTTRYEKKIGKKVTEKMLDHELDRFVSMSEDKLLTRLKKISTPIKAEAFRQMAFICKQRNLYYAAKNRLAEIGVRI
jgi:hypothetical protein